MNRRALLAAAGTTALVGCLDDAGDDGNGNGDDGNGDDGATEPPFEIATIDAPGSEAGTVRVPQSDRAMLLNFTRTQCPTSRALLSTIAEAKDGLEAEGYAVDGDDPDVRFCSITDGTTGPSPSDAELAAWFEDNGGDWPIGRDETGVCNDYYEVVGFPTTVAIDGEGTVRWRNRSGTRAAVIERAVVDVLEGPADGGNESANATARLARR
jgi:hypothetical protein